MNKKFTRIIELIKHVSQKEFYISDYRKNIEESKIGYLLIKEYFRRVMTLNQFLQFNHKTFVDFFCLDVVCIIDENLSVNIDDAIDEVCPDVRNIVYPILKVICHKCVKLLVLAEQGNILANEYYDIYEPLLLFFATGGTINHEHGWLEIGAYINPIDELVSQSLESLPINIYEITSGLWRGNYM